jgi:hypothetical protein
MGQTKNKVPYVTDFYAALDHNSDVSINSLPP